MTRANDSKTYRIAAAEWARGRDIPAHEANGDEERLKDERYSMSFSKGLKHSDVDGLVEDAAHFRELRSAIDGGFVKMRNGAEPFTEQVTSVLEDGRPWEAPTAGQVFDLQGPDAQAVTMPPAPALGSDELIFEMAEVYELALLRDTPFTQFQANPPSVSTNVALSADRLNALAYARDGFPNRPRTTAPDGRLDRQTIFRGASTGVEVGPYVSQFLLIGNPQFEDGQGTGARDGYIRYGAQLIDQRVPVAAEVDYMTTGDTWRRVQDGGNTRNNDALFAQAPRRFITTPRDLATYVHDDALYQAYLNACLILLGYQAPFDEAFNALSGRGKIEVNGKDTHRAAGGFALYGGPHILSLVTEVATRALKAVRYQKFNVHLRLRPEALAARVHYREQIVGDGHPIARPLYDAMARAMAPTLQEIRARNSFTNRAPNGQPGEETEFLPMAFQEGSPMHPTYGAGHATVAGACVTILKAFFDTSAEFVGQGHTLEIKAAGSGKDALAFVPTQDGARVVAAQGLQAPLTVGGELNKLAANISIGRNMAGVHYFSDYFDSVRMGEAIAIGILEEQAMGYPTDEFITALTTFDGIGVQIGRDGAMRLADGQPYFPR